MRIKRRCVLMTLGSVLWGALAQAALPQFETTAATERREGGVYQTADGREIYWPKAAVSPEDVYEGRVHKRPMDRRADVSPQWDGFAKERLRQVPDPGVHPRILITPTDVEQIRANIAKGEDAPRNFRMTWDLFRQNADIDPETGKPKKLADKRQTGPSWMESWNFTHQCLYALIADDGELARELIPQLLDAAEKGRVYYEAEKAQLHPSAFRNFWMATQSPIETDAPLPQGSRHAWNLQFAQEYDYLYPYMTEDERAKVRDYIALIVRDRISHGFELPANKHIINHEIMAWKWLLLPMAIEGEPGFDQGKYSPKTVLEFGAQKFQEVPKWYVSPTGIMYENVKGHMPKSVMVALARRDGGAMLAHPHIRSAVAYTFFAARHLRSLDVDWTRPPIRTRDQREKEFWDPANPDSHFWTLGSAGFGGSYDSWVMSYLFPEDKAYDFVFKVSNTAANYDFWDKDYNTWIRAIPDPAIRLWCAHDGLLDDDGKPVDWNETPVDFESKLAVSDPERGVAELAEGFGKNALRSRIECRSDLYTGGHESPEFGNFTVSADGVYWAPYQGPYQPVIARNVVTIDGFAGKYPPVPARFVGLFDSDAAAAVVCDYAEALQFTQPGKTWLIDSPGLKTRFHAWMQPFSGWDFDRDFQIPFMPHLRWLNEGKASTDFSHWDGQNPWPQYFQRVLPPVEKAWRTINLVRGDPSTNSGRGRPYMLIVDDVKMDDQLHDYRWNFNLQREMVLIRQPDAFTFVIGRGDIEWQRTGSGPGGYANSGLNWKRTPKKGEPLLMVKVLNVNAEYELPATAFEYSKTWPRIVVPARTTAPDYRVMIYPFREGDPTPIVVWSEDRSRLALRIGEQVDQFDFREGSGGRTVFTLTRGGRIVQTMDAAPPRPQFADLPPVHRATRYERNGAELGPAMQPQDSPPVPVKVFTERATLVFENIRSGQDVEYVLEQSDVGQAPLPVHSAQGTGEGARPTKEWTRYSGPEIITESCTVMARTVARDWRFGDNTSPVVTARFTKQTPLPSTSDPRPPTSGSGLRCEVFETFTAEWDRHGFMQPDLNMLPDLDKLEPILDCAVKGLTLPPVVPQREPREQFKGFYRFTGFLEVPATGVYTFRVNSMAPVQLTLAEIAVIDETGPYHQDLNERYGQVALAAGQHAFALVVGDAAFWRMSQLGAMAFSVAWSRDNGKTFADIPATALSSPYAAREDAFRNPYAPVETELPLLEAVSAEVETGLLCKTYDRTAYAKFSDFKRSSEGAAEGLLDLGDAKPVAVKHVADMITGSNFDGELKVYEGYYKAPFSGLYEFQLEGAGNNALRIGDTWVVANNIPGMRGTGRVRLERGLQPLRIYFGRSGGVVQVKTPVNRSFVPIAFPDLFAKAGVVAQNDPEDWLVLDNPLPGKPLFRTPLCPEQVDVAESVQAVNDPERGDVLQFDGSGGIALKNVPMVRDVWTLSFWMKREADQDMRFLKPAEEGVSAGWWRGQVNAGPPRRAGTGVPLQREIQIGEWFHVTITADETVTIYINGEQRAQTWYDPSDTGGSHAHLLFRRSDGYTLFDNFKGQIADLKFWNAIVSPKR